MRCASIAAFALLALVVMLTVLQQPGVSAMKIGGSAANARDEPLDKNTDGVYQLKRRSFFRRLWRRLLSWFGIRSLPKDEWKNREERKHSAPTFDELVQHMEALDQAHEQLYQRRLLQFADVFIISPTAALGDDVQEQQSAHTVFNPALFHGERYNVAFKVGQRFPENKPYLTVYLSSCANNKPRRKDMMMIQTFYVDPKTKKVRLHPSIDGELESAGPSAASSATSNYDLDALIYRQRYYANKMKKLYQTVDGAWVYEWQVPGNSELLPFKNYCFLFDMSSVDVSAMEKIKPNSVRLKDVRPRGAISKMRPTDSFHQVKASPSFAIQSPPQLFSKDWFARQFGGKDLMRFMGGELFSFEYFRITYELEDGKWPQALFEQNIHDRADDVTQWFGDVLDDTPSRWQVGFVQRPNTYNLGYADAEDRRHARNRAIGLLYHAKGRDVLYFIGQTFNDVAKAYEETMLPSGRWRDFFINDLREKIFTIWNTHFAGFRHSRLRLTHWIGQLKKLCDGYTPTIDLMRQLNEQCGKKDYLRKPVTGEMIESPKKIYEKIMEHMTDMVKYEIKLVLWRMGELILERKGRANRFFDQWTGLSTYNQLKYAEYAGIIRLYGTKFMAMASSFELGSAAGVFS